METPVSFPESWTPPRELSRALPREVRTSGRGMFMALLAVVLLAASVPLFLWERNQGAQQAARVERLRTEGRVATGEIVRLWHKSGSSKRRPAPMVTYAFSAGGRRFAGESSVPEARWDRLQTAGFLPVRFVPADPNINHPLDWEESPQPVWLSFVLAGVLVGCGIAFLARLRRQARVMAEGLPTPGIVTGCYRTKGGWMVRYRFRTKDGAVVHGSSQAGRLEAGATVCVLYLQSNPRRNLMYPGCLYRVQL
jgi:hypothetical protein